MGLDGVELVMAWEERFGIAIPDRAAEQMLTPHAAIDYIYAQVGRPVAPICLTQRTFYRLRQAFASALGPAAPALTPRTSLSDLLPWETRTLVWGHLEAASGLQAWPSLERPTWLARLIGLIGLGVPALLVFTQQVPIAWAAVLAVALLGLTLDATRFAARAAPAAALTGGELARYLAGANAEALLPPPTRWTRDQVRDVVRATIVEQLGVRSDFSDDAHFVRDLGVS